jgi:S1-C subfamily serine protease
VVDTAPGGPADKAGIDPGVVIVRFDGEDVTDSDGLGDLILAHDPGDEVDVEVVEQDGSRRTVTVALGVRPVPLPTP